MAFPSHSREIGLDGRLDFFFRLRIWEGADCGSSVSDKAALAMELNKISRRDKRRGFLRIMLNNDMHIKRSGQVSASKAQGERYQSKDNNCPTGSHYFPELFVANCN